METRVIWPAVIVGIVIVFCSGGIVALALEGNAAEGVHTFTEGFWACVVLGVGITAVCLGAKGTED